MSETTSFTVIARLRCNFTTKFGLPRQSGLVEELSATVVFEPEYRNPDALRGIEGYSHLWLIWGFSRNQREGWSPVVRPPRLGGNTRMGVFATRSPFRPNPIGLSCVRLTAVEKDDKLGTVLRVAGADMMDGTPIYDIKPYLPYADSRPDAVGGFADERAAYALEVTVTPQQLSVLPPDSRAALEGVLSGDPRPSYQHDPNRVYGFEYAGCDVRFTVDGGRLTVVEIVPLTPTSR